MAIMRIAFAAAALYYIAPHVVSDVAKSVRPNIEAAKSGLSTDIMTTAALEYCKKNTQACLKFVETTLTSEDVHFNNKAKPTTIPVPINAALRTTLPDNPPLPPLKSAKYRADQR